MFLAAFFLLAPADDLPADDAEAAAIVLARWAEATRDVTAVRATYRGFEYDSTFHTVKLTEGEFHHDPTAGTLATIRPRSEKKHYESGGIVHKPIPGDASRWFWDATDGTLLAVDDVRQEFTHGSTGQFPLMGWAADRSPDRYFPFAPGRPFGPRRQDWKFSVASRQVDDVFLSAVPLRTEDAIQMSRALLQFRRSDGTLRAVKLFSPSRDGATMFLFDVVDFNPGPPPRPTLEGYRDLIADPEPPVAAAEPDAWDALSKFDPPGQGDPPGESGMRWLFLLKWQLLLL
ncbi:hypothetical protein [Alienimonas chondri]|uniref:Uncharacterized protein n=1 Tax=Alienimonas chondri TaxID=2681879 RepID=A0ABX1VIL0_9PLAN|nr:hypothetical protein [Alienimonas chondri]NNJ27113.1 hypothetical protein [Alienimonas chondri]